MGPLDAHHAKLVARALELVQPDVAECAGGGMATIVRGPSAQVIASIPAPGGVAVTMLAHFRSSHLAQSGSDWGEHAIRIYELTLADDGSIAAERLVHDRCLFIRESAEDGYDDAGVAQSVADEVVAKSPRVEAKPSSERHAVRARLAKSNRPESPPTDELLAALRRALADDARLEALAGSSTPVAALLRRAGAFVDAVYEEVQYTDWNGANVGTGAGELIRAAIPLDPTLHWDELAPLLDMGPSARRLVARHPATPTEALLVLAGDAEWWVQRAVLDRPVIDPAVLDRLRHSHHSVIRALTAPQISLEEHLIACATSEHVFERSRAAEQGRLSLELMEQLAGDLSEEVRHKIALRRDLTPRALARLLEHDVTPRIKLALAHSPALTPVARAQLGIPEEGPPDSEARARSAGSAALSPERARAFARDESFLVRSALAANPAADATVLEHLMDDPHASVRRALASNPCFTELALLATDTSSAVRRAIAARSDTPRDVLEMLARDGQTVVRDQASETLRRVGA
ncbi:MAG: hypothetical protein IPM35_37735 [Myxococcales bacterium]|nr:hypothetical protein [Myxococcales bacterium]